MRLLDTLKVNYRSEERLIEIYQGDLTALTPDESVDILVLSAFPNDYIPTHTSLIGALYRKGISVEQLARNKAADLRSSFSCWMSQEVISSVPGIRFKHILCFEPLTRGKPPEVVGDIFRSLAPFLSDPPQMSTVAMPLVACGDQMVPVSSMISPLLDAAVHWMSLGFPLKCLRIVAYSDDQATELQNEFARLKPKYQNVSLESTQAFEYDVFISYAHDNDKEASRIVDELKKVRPDLRIFLDKLSLNTGAAWQQEIFEAIDACRKFLAMYSPAYLASKVCKEEFNIALYRHRDSEEGCLFPAYIYSAHLPTYMKMLQYVDCREGDVKKLQGACGDLLSILK
ncbi:MAG TPA: toll/interleukin-1 receptor domain-containing protein [Blastocatellia bacterium]|nr:toll/interleukin-1 receptor domain-containing protein [Blastocatellia bacterium]